jgi:hypothetical protein
MKHIRIDIEKNALSCYMKMQESFVHQIIIIQKETSNFMNEKDFFNTFQKFLKFLARIRNKSD